MRCESCSREIVETAIRCYHCGAKVGEVSLPVRPVEQHPEKNIETALDEVILMSSGAFERANQIVEERKREIDLMLRKVSEESEVASERLKHIRTREGILRRKEEELKALEAKKKEIEERMSYLEKKEDELKTMEERLGHLEDEISAEKERIEKEIADRDQTIATLEVEGERQRREIAGLSITLKEKEKEVVRARTEENELTAALRQRIAALEAETDERRKTRIAHDLELMNLQEAVKESEKRLKEKDVRIDSLTKERDGLRGDLTSFEDKLETITKWSESISVKLKSAETTIPALANARMVLEQRVSSLEGNLKWKDAKLKEFQAMQNALPLLQRAKSTLEGRVTQLEDELQDREKWAREASAMKQKIDALESDRERLGHGVKSLDTENISLKQEMMLLRRTIASTHEQVEKERGAASQAVRERDGLRLELESASKSKNELETKWRALASQLETLKRDIELGRGIIAEKDNELSIVNSKVRTLENQNEALRSSLDDIKKERDDLLSEMDAMFIKQDITIKEITESRGAIEASRKQAIDLQGQLSQERTRTASAEEMLASTQKALAKIKEDRDSERAAKDEIARLHKKEVEGLKGEIDALSKAGEQFKGKDRGSAETEALRARVTALEAECASLNKENVELQMSFTKLPPIDASFPLAADIKKREMILTSELERYKNEAAVRNEEMERLRAEAGSLRKRATELLEASKIQVEERRRFQEENEGLGRTLGQERELRQKTEGAMKRAVTDLNALQEEVAELRQLKSVIDVERQRLIAKERELADIEITCAKQQKEMQRERESIERERAGFKEKSETLKRKEQDLQEFVTETFLVETKGEKKKGKANQKAMEAKLAAAFEMAGKSKQQKESGGPQVEEMQEYVSKVIFDYEKRLDSLSEQSDSMRRELEDKRKENMKLKSMLQEFVSPQPKNG